MDAQVPQNVDVVVIGFVFNVFFQFATPLFWTTTPMTSCSGAAATRWVVLNVRSERERVTRPDCCLRCSIPVRPVFGLEYP